MARHSASLSSCSDVCAVCQSTRGCHLLAHFAKSTVAAAAGRQTHSFCCKLRYLLCSLAPQVTINNPAAAPDTAGLVIDSTADVFVHDLDVSTGACSFAYAQPSNLYLDAHSRT